MTEPHDLRDHEGEPDANEPETPESRVEMPEEGQAGDPSSAVRLSASSSVSGSMHNLAYGRYDELNQTLRLEFISDADARRCLFALKTSAYCALVALLILLVLKCTSSAGRYFVLNRGFYISNVVIGVGLLALLGGYYAFFVWRTLVCCFAGKQWSSRRWAAVRRNLIRGGVMITILALYTATNIAVLAYPKMWCTRSHFVSIASLLTWTLWNFQFVMILYDSHCLCLVNDPTSDRKDLTVRDMPISFHWPKLVLWMVVEGFLIWTTVTSIQSSVVRITFRNPEDHHCTWGVRLKCTPSVSVYVSVSLTLFGFVVYWAVSLFFILRSWKQVHQRAYLEFRVVHSILRLQIRFNLSFSVVILSALLLWLAGPDACANYSLAWYGMLPMMLMMSGIQYMGLYIALPRSPTAPAPKINELYQAFAWTEASKPKQIARRNKAFGDASAEALKEPMFCVETAIKLFYFSALIYDFTEADGHAFSTLPEPIRELLGEVEQAMSFYKLTQRRLFYDRTLETKVLSAWSDRVILISIRGSAARSNFIADAELLQTVHPPRRKVDGKVPRVHVGFLKTWTAGGINELVVEHVEDLISSADDRSEVQIFLTGHSLGGAVATLAAYDIMKRSKLRCDQVAVYTFGCPRVGNHAFARDYAATVPDTWSIINDQDVVTRAMKIFGLYKRAGHRVIINSAGDLIIRPSLFELTLMQLPFRATPIHHHTTSYQASLHAVLRSQMDKSKRHREGLSGVLELLNSAPIVHEALDQMAQALGTNLSDQLRSLSMASFLNKRSDSAVAGSFRGSERSDRLEAAIRAAVEDVPVTTDASGEEVYETVFDGALGGEGDASRGGGPPDAVVVDLVVSAPTPPTPPATRRGRAAQLLGGVWRSLRRQGAETAAIARQAAEDVHDKLHPDEEDREREEEARAAAAAEQLPAPRGPAERRAVSTSALLGARRAAAAQAGATAAASAAGEPRNVVDGVQDGAPRGQPAAGSAQGKLLRRRCYIIPEEEGNGADPTHARLRTRWACPLLAEDKDLPYNASVVDGNILTIGSSVPMKACKGKPMSAGVRSSSAPDPVHVGVDV